MTREKEREILENVVYITREKEGERLESRKRHQLPDPEPFRIPKIKVEKREGAKERNLSIANTVPEPIRMSYTGLYRSGYSDTL